jgi:hypothetical protein
MKLAALQPGTKVIYGKRDDLLRGRNGKTTYVLAVGKFTTVYGPCGTGAMPYRGYSGESPRVVATFEEKQYAGPDGYANVWTVHIVSLRCLMDPAEYKVKADVVRKQELEVQRYQKRRVDAHAKDTKAVAKALKVPESWIEWVHPWRGEEHWVPRICATEETVQKAIGGKAKLEALLIHTRAWEKEPKPNECRL